jgi:hypothetical protein
VFRNISAHGIIDLVAYNPSSKEITLIDVKTLSLSEPRRDGVRRPSFARLSPEQLSHNVKTVTVDLDTKHITLLP